MAYDKSFCETGQEQLAEWPASNKSGGGTYDGEPGLDKRSSNRGVPEKTYEDLGGKPTEEY